ncbi:hypothetical protein F4809DRAFT_117955 [Biscogniauxia mediterranea]|nr:hypothetical protein F4809DRAFT_117955 [Biscogniauxia mediterranea]
MQALYLPTGRPINRLIFLFSRWPLSLCQALGERGAVLQPLLRHQISPYFFFLLPLPQVLPPTYLPPCTCGGTSMTSHVRRISKCCHDEVRVSRLVWLGRELHQVGTYLQAPVFLCSFFRYFGLFVFGCLYIAMDGRVLFDRIGYGWLVALAMATAAATTTYLRLQATLQYSCMHIRITLQYTGAPANNNPTFPFPLYMYPSAL